MEIGKWIILSVPAKLYIWWSINSIKDMIDTEYDSKYDSIMKLVFCSFRAYSWSILTVSSLSVIFIGYGINLIIQLWSWTI